MHFKNVKKGNAQNGKLGGTWRVQSELAQTGAGDLAGENWLVL